jgi:hypothetical protein
VQSVLDQADRVHTVLGRVRRVHPSDDAVEIEIDDGQETSRVQYDLVVTAIGFDSLWWLPLFTDAAHAALAQAVGSAGRLETRDGPGQIVMNSLFPALTAGIRRATAPDDGGVRNRHCTIEKAWLPRRRSAHGHR